MALRLSRFHDAQGLVPHVTEGAFGARRVAPPSSCTWRRFRGWQRQWAARATAPAMEPGKGRPPRSGHFPQCSPCDVHSHHHRTLVGNRSAFGRLPGIAAFQGLVGNYNLELAAITSFPKHGERGKLHGAGRPVLEKSSPPAAVQPRGSCWAAAGRSPKQLVFLSLFSIRTQRHRLREQPFFSTQASA